MEINYIVIGIASVLAMVLGAIWYGPLFGKKWMEIIGVSPEDMERRKEMQKGATKLYIVQFILTLFQVLVLAHLIADTEIAGPIERSLWIWGAFIVPTVAAGAMWNNDSAKISWARFLIQAGYQLILFIMFGFMIGTWM